jgi:hypothetical protein
MYGWNNGHDAMKINTEAMMNGDQPLSTPTALWRRARSGMLSLTGMMFAGRQNFSKATVASNEKIADTMSTRPTSWWFDQ